MPRPRLQEQTDEQQQMTNENVTTDFLLASNAGHLCVPRTPGVDGTGQVNKTTSRIKIEYFV